MPNIPGGVVQPGVYDEVTTISSGVSLPGSTRIACVIGTGTRSEVIVGSANGSGNDGVNSSYTGTTGRDGRHFALQLFPLVSNRLQLFKNGVLLNGLEQVPDTDPFSNKYDYRVDINTGHIELQTAYLVDQGGSFYTAGASNVGLGNLDGYGGVTLVDPNAPTETWTIKCISVRRNSGNTVIQETARFLAFGSVSGAQLDSNGNPVVWISNGQQVSNGILQFAISETQPGGSGVSTSPFREGDYFTVKVNSGALVKNDSLTASYIATTDINDPEIFTDMASLTAKHGTPTLDNTVSLGGQLAFANSTPALMTLQAAPPLPRRTSYNLVSNFNASSTTVDDFVIPLPVGVYPDTNSNIHVFVTDPVSKVESQLLPNKYTFYTLGTSGNPSVSSFVFSDTAYPAGYDFSYSVIEAESAINYGNDGYLNRSLSSSVLADFSVSGLAFDSSYVGKKLKIFDSTQQANNGTFDIISVSNGILKIQASGTVPFTPFVNRAGTSFHLINPTTGATVASSTGTDGVLVALAGTSNATFDSASVNFTAIPALTGMKIVITGDILATNNGTFDILSVNGSDQLTIAKSFNSQSNVEYEVLDPASTSAFLVLNHNIVPNNNALRISLVDRKDASFYDPGWTTALETLEAVELDMIVPLPRQTMSLIFQNALNHCLAQSNIRNKHERILLTGAINGLTVDNVVGNKPAAVEDIGILEGIQGDTVAEVLAGNTEDLTNYSVKDAFGFTYRCGYFYPDQIVVQVGTDNQILDGFYMAAAAAGFISSLANLSMPITNKVLSGFTILRNRLLKPLEIDSLLNNGIIPVVPVSGGGRVIWGKTTTESGFPEEEELSIVFIRDRIAKSFRDGCAGFVGQPNDADTVQIITTRVISILKGFVSQKLITDYDSITVKQDATDPRQVNVSCRVVPVYPLNWLYIKVNIGQT